MFVGRAEAGLEVGGVSVCIDAISSTDGRGISAPALCLSNDATSSGWSSISNDASGDKIFVIQSLFFFAFDPHVFGTLTGGSFSKLLTLVFSASVLVVSSTLGPTRALENSGGLS
jgi:hypothetical protein